MLSRGGWIQAVHCISLEQLRDLSGFGKHCKASWMASNDKMPTVQTSAVKWYAEAQERQVAY
jgi:hypothetical protein